jgi:hypothetical protein
VGDVQISYDLLQSVLGYASPNRDSRFLLNAALLHFPAADASTTRTGNAVRQLFSSDAYLQNCPVICLIGSNQAETFKTVAMGGKVKANSAPDL